jgi:hypothetical protein
MLTVRPVSSRALLAYFTLLALITVVPVLTLATSNFALVVAALSPTFIVLFLTRMSVISAT